MGARNLVAILSFDYLVDGCFYHYAIRRLKKDQESIVRERIADAMFI
jgi:hypothetical protein